MRPIDISLPVSSLACRWQSSCNMSKWYTPARRYRFARKGQIPAAAADGPVGPGSYQPGAHPAGRRPRAHAGPGGHAAEVTGAQLPAISGDLTTWTNPQLVLRPWQQP